MKKFNTLVIFGLISCSDVEKTTSTNSPPTFSSISITPSIGVTTSTEVLCFASVRDEDNEPVTLSYQWTTPEGDILADTPELILSPEVIQPTNELICTATASDGVHTLIEQTSITVENTHPIVSNVAISPQEAFADTTLECSFTVFDADLEEPTHLIQWKKGEDLLSSEQNIALDPSIFAAGDNIICEVLVEDGYGGTHMAYSSIIVNNTAPTLASVVLLPEAPTTQDVITCIPQEAADINDDTVDFRYTWWIDGVEQSETSSALTGFQVGQEIQCTVTPTDGLLDGESHSASVTIVNTKPVISSVTIQPNPIQANSQVECIVTANDVDGDTWTSSVVWTTTDTLGTEQTLQLSPSDVSVGDLLTCTATVIDDHGGSAQDIASMIVENTAPIFTAPATISGTPTSGSTLSCFGEVSDVNDGPLSTTTSWTLLDGTLLGSSPSMTIDPAEISVGDEIVCTVAAVDSDGETTSQTTSIVVVNTPPMVAAISIINSTVYTNGEIEAIIEITDADTTQVLSWTVDWHVVDSTGLDTLVVTGASASLDGQHFDKGEQVYLVVTPFDGISYGPSQTSGIVDVLNSPPQAVTISLSPSNPNLDLDDVVCTVSPPSIDIDGDTVEYTYDWIDAEGQIVRTSQKTDTMDTLSAASLLFPQSLTCRVTPFDGEASGESTEESVSVAFDCNCPQTTTRDFSFTYWPENFRHANFNLHGFYMERHFLTGYYGAVIDMSNGSILNLSQISNLNMEDAALSDEAWLAASLSSEVTYSVAVNGTTFEGTDFLNSNETGTHGEDNPSMLMDMGRFQQHIEIPEVLYQGNAHLLGSLSIVSSPQSLVLTHRTTSTAEYNGSISIQTSLSGYLWNQSQVSILDGTRAIEAIDADGVTWAVIAPESSDTITQAVDGTIIVSRTVSSLGIGEEISIPVLLLPAEQLENHQVMMYLDPESTVDVTYAQMNQSDTLTSSVQYANWDWERGAFAVPLGSIQGSGANHHSTNWSNGTDFNLYNRHRLDIAHSSSAPLHVPLFLDGPINTTFNITGGAPLFRSITEEPTGLPIQVSKNWHISGYWPNWFHMYSTPSVPSGNHTMELTVAIGKWGETFAASHAQLSLVGWGTNQQWDESALGAWGESITYDPDKTLRRAMVDDVRPFLMDVAGEYNWTGNVGGADFLKYVDINRPWRDQQPTQLKTTYTAPGPVMTDVTYSGITTDDTIALQVQTHLVRTDDIVRAYYILHYEFLSDVEYARLGLFQIAADNYSDNGFSKYAYGDSTGVLFDGIVPNHNTTGYASDSDRGIELTGEYPWVFMYDSTRTGGNLPEHVADVGFIVRQYSATINGSNIANPHININRTKNGGWSQMAFELGVPFDASNVLIEAGSTIDAIVEYIVVPNDISLYYGPSTDMAGVDPTLFGTTDIIELLASTNTIHVETSIGTLEQNQPTIITGVTGEVAAQFEVSGGFGYSPITIQGLFRADGWQLQHFENGTWIDVDQSVHDNDYWQTKWDAEAMSYALTFSVDIDSSTEFRLTR